MQWKLFADLAEVTGDRTVAVEVATPTTVDEALEALFEVHPALEDRVLDESGELRDHINLLKNGENVRHEAGLATELESTDELALFPPVSGG